MNELYDRLAERYPSDWGPGSTRAPCAGRYKADFEKAFTELDLRRAPGRPPGVSGLDGLSAVEAQRPLAVYFSEFRLDRTQKDFYSRLIKFLRRSEVIEDCFFSTLNYECIFEQACIASGLRVEYLLQAAAAPLHAVVTDDWPGLRQSTATIYFAKLHGSCNFSTNADQRLTMHLSSTGTHVESRIDWLDPCAPLTERVVAGLFPIMTQISPDRDDFLAPSKIFQIRQMWGKAIRNASLIVIIGAAPREYDAHIWNPLNAATGDIVFIGGKRDADSWRDCNRNLRWLGGTFHQGFRPLLRCLATHKRSRGGGFTSYLLDIFRTYLY